MQIKKAFKYRLKPSKIQEMLLTNFAGHTRFLWNKCLGLNLWRLKNHQRILRYQELDFWSKLWKKSEEYGFLNECPAHIIQQKLRDLDKAFQDAFDKSQPNKRLPKFKKRMLNDSFRFPAPEQIKLENRHIILPKLGRLRFYKSQELTGNIKNVTIRREGLHWVVSIQVETEMQVLEFPKATSAIGIDLGIKNFVTTSNGEQVAPIHSFRKLEKKLRRTQRCFSRKKRFSANWKKAQRKVIQIHRKITQKRRDFQHKISAL
jgi:transposase